jgi:hypothetical protein
LTDWGIARKKPEEPREVLFREAKPEFTVNGAKKGEKIDLPFDPYNEWAFVGEDYVVREVGGALRSVNKYVFEYTHDIIEPLPEKEEKP